VLIEIVQPHLGPGCAFIRACAARLMRANSVAELGAKGIICGWKRVLTKYWLKEVPPPPVSSQTAMGHVFGMAYLSARAAARRRQTQGFAPLRPRGTKPNLSMHRISLQGSSAPRVHVSVVVGRTNRASLRLSVRCADPCRAYKRVKAPASRAPDGRRHARSRRGIAWFREHYCPSAF